MTREEIDQKCLDQANSLEVEFFDIVNEGLPDQHRVLKAGKTQEDFGAQHALIWQNHEQELIASGFIEALKPPEPARDLAIEIDGLKARLDKLEVKPLET